MTQDLLELEREVKFMLEKTLPEGRSAYVEDVTESFKRWQSTPQYPIHQGLLKLVAGFHVRALKPELRGARFIKQRNVILDYLVQEFRDLGGMPDVGSKRWSRVAARISSLMED